MKKVLIIFLFIIICFSIYYFIPKNNSNIIAINNLKYQITIDDVSGTINPESTKTITIITTNKELILANKIIEEYEDDNLLIAAYIDGELSTSFPEHGYYKGIVNYSTLFGTSAASGSASWDGTRWWTLTPSKFNSAPYIFTVTESFNTITC